MKLDTTDNQYAVHRMADIERLVETFQRISLPLTCKTILAYAALVIQLES
jgi:hypothetical protein